MTTNKQLNPKYFNCIKLRQRLIREKTSALADYFPFDLFYLIHKDLEDKFKRAYRYYLVMEVDTTMLTLLRALNVEDTRDITVTRDDDRYEKVPKEVSFKDDIANGEWLLVVPTHVLSKKSKNSDKPDHSSIGYLSSRVLSLKAHNTSLPLPNIQVQTPRTRIPMLCAVCTKLPSFYEGKCSPGTKMCRESAHTRLDLDTERDDSEQESIDKAGGE